MAKAAKKPTARQSTKPASPAMDAARKVAANDPAGAPDKYIVMLDGACMEPLIKDGVAVMVDKNAKCLGGDLVVIYFRPEKVRPGGHNCSLKRLVMAVPPYVKWPWREHPESEVHAVVICEMLNPPEQFVFQAQDLLAVHKVVGQVPVEAKFDPETRAYSIPAGHAVLSS